MGKHSKPKSHNITGGSASLDGSMPVEGTEPLRAFAEGTGKRKYSPNDPSVERMQKSRAAAYRKYGIGVATAANSGAAWRKVSVVPRRSEDTKMTFTVSRRTLLDILRLEKKKSTRITRRKGRRTRIKSKGIEHQNSIKGIDKLRNIAKR